MFQLKLKEKNNCRGRPLCLPKEKNYLDSLKENPISFWIDSSGGPPHLCNQSLIGSDPKYVIYGYLNKVFEKRTGELANQQVDTNCFDFLEKKIHEEAHNQNGIFVGYISYDLFTGAPLHRCTVASENCNIHRATEPQCNGASYPDFFFAYFDRAEPGAGSWETRIHSSQLPAPSSRLELFSNMTDDEYIEKVKLIKEEIRAGNVYQVNLTREYSLEIGDINEVELYLRLREMSPNPYGCFFKTPFVTILSSSPEEFLFIKDGHIRTRPIKGTLPKGINDIDPKNKAENIMIVDLERNDLGRICEYGSVEARKLLDVEQYKHLNHVVSTVEGKLRKNVTLKEIFEAIFPSGSITGAPKIAAMKVIEKLEPTKRGGYTGSFGYIRTDGTMNFNILIRTIFITRNVIARRHEMPTKQSYNSMRKEIASSGLSPPRNDTLHVTFNVGGGIVADSDPYSELEEIRLKAEGIMSALGLC